MMHISSSWIGSLAVVQKYDLMECSFILLFYMYCVVVTNRHIVYRIQICNTFSLHKIIINAKK